MKFFAWADNTWCRFEYDWQDATTTAQTLFVLARMTAAGFVIFPVFAAGVCVLGFPFVLIIAIARN